MTASEQARLAAETIYNDKRSRIDLWEPEELASIIEAAITAALADTARYDRLWTEYTRATAVVALAALNLARLREAESLLRECEWPEPFDDRKCARCPVCSGLRQYTKKDHAKDCRLFRFLSPVGGGEGGGGGSCPPAKDRA